MKSNKGFSLVEMIIVVALIGIITTAIVTVFDVSIKSHTSQMLKAENQMNIRYATTYFRERVREADLVQLGRAIQMLPKEEYENGPYDRLILSNVDMDKDVVDMDDKVKNQTRYEFNEIEHIIYQKIKNNKNPLFINIGNFDIYKDDEKSKITIVIESFKDEEYDKKYSGTTVTETIEIYIPKDKRNLE